MRYCVLVCLLLVGCGHSHDHDDGEQFICDGDEDETRAGAVTVGQSNIFSVEVVSSEPAVHQVGVNSLVVRLEEVATATPVDGADFTKIETFTAKHDHGAPGDPEAIGRGNGEYELTDLHYVHHGPWHLDLLRTRWAHARRVVRCLEQDVTPKLAT